VSLFPKVDNSLASYFSVEFEQTLYHIWSIGSYKKLYSSEWQRVSVAKG